MTPAPHASALTRRRLLRAGLATAGVVALEALPGAPALARAGRGAGGPRATAAAMRLPAGRRIGPVRVPGGFDLAGLRWRGHAHPRIELRARRRGGRWTEWLPVGHARDHGPDATAPNPATDPVWTGRADEVELRLDRALPALTLHTVRTDGARRRIVVARSAQSDGIPPIITRAEWGGDTLHTRGHPQYGTVQMAFVHHTVNANDYGPEDSAGIVLAIAKYHIQSNGWNDIGYNFLVDKYGQIFEGRAGGIDQPVIGAQAQGWNSVSTGVANLGTFETVPETDAAMSAMSQLIAWKLALHGAPVEGEVDLVSAGGASNRYPAGRAVTFQRISGHRDGCKTSCPGTALYDQLPELRRRAAAHHYPIAVPVSADTHQLTLAASAASVAVDTAVQVTGALVGQDGTPVPGAAIAIQAHGATSWNPVAHAVTDAAGHFAAPVTVHASAHLRAYYAGGANAGRARLASPVVSVAAVPAISARISGKRVQAGGRVQVAADLRPHRSHVEVAVEMKGRDGRYRRVARERLRVKGSRGAATVRLAQAGLYRFVVSAPGDAHAAAASTPPVYVRATHGPSQGDPVVTRTGGASATAGPAALTAPSSGGALAG